MSEKTGSGSNAPQDDIFESFVRQRAVLNQSLDESKRTIDTWFERQPMPAPLSALANLEVLLKTRRDLLSDLVNLDDSFMLHLIQMRSGQSDSTGSRT